MRCPACGIELRQAARFCDACGAALAGDDRPGAPDLRSYTPRALANRIIAGAREQAGERKQVTVLFADVRGSMDLSERTDAELWHAILDRFFSILCTGVQRFEGTVSQFTGDGIMALFGAPIAHEDHARRACHAALELTGRLRSYAAELRRDHDLDFPVRLGLNSGEVVLGSIGDDLNVEYTALGHSVGLAQRMEALAEPGSAYLTDRTASLVAGYFELEEVGRVEVKGVTGSVRVWRLAGTGPALTALDVARERGLSRFTGREREIAVLDSALDRALDGAGEVVAVSGDPGLGKSRLAYEFACACRDRGVAVHEAHALPHGQAIALLPVIELLRGFLGIRSGDTPERARERTARALASLDGAEDDHQLVFELLGIEEATEPVPIDPEARQRRLVRLLRRLMRSQARRVSTLVVLEDLQWLDPASEPFVDALVGAAHGTRALVVATFRPEYDAGWLGQGHCRALPLSPLSASASGELLRDLLGSDPSLAGLEEPLRARAGGNPFFIEEAVRSLAETGKLVGEQGAYRLVAPAGELAIPASVQVLLAARIDRLPEREKSVLQAASVIGKRDIAAPVLAAVTGAAEGEIDAALGALAEAGFIECEPDSGEPRYAFRHPLTQEVAYGVQLTRRRRETHAAVARAIEEIHPGRLDERAALLAYHFEQAGEARVAVRWHAQAAERAGINDQREAVRHWRRVRALVGELPESRETAELARAADVWLLDLGWRTGISAAEAERIFTEGRALTEHSTARSGLAYLLLPYGMIRAQLGHLDEFLKLRSEAQRIADETGDSGARLTTRAGLMYASLLTGRLNDALAGAAEAIELVGDDPSVGVGAGIRSFGALAFFSEFRGFLLGLSGDLAGGERALSRGLTVARERSDLELIAWGRILQVWLTRYSGVTEDALGDAAEAVEIADRIGGSFTLATAHLAMGTAELVSERWEPAATTFERALTIAEAGGAGSEYSPWMLAYLAEALLGLGDVASAREKAQLAVRLARERDLPLFELQAQLALGRVLLATGTEAGLAASAMALDRAGSLAARTEARSAVPLVGLESMRLARLRGDDDAARRELEAARRGLTEVGARGHLARLDSELAGRQSPGSGRRPSSGDRRG